MTWGDIAVSEHILNADLLLYKGQCCRVVRITHDPAHGLGQETRLRSKRAIYKSGGTDVLPRLGLQYEVQAADCACTYYGLQSMWDDVGQACR